MVRRFLGATRKLVAGVSSAAVQTATDLTENISTEFITANIEKLAERFDAVTVPVRCIPTGPTINEYRIEADLTELERALAAERFVRPRVIVSAISDEIDRKLLTERLIDAFVPILEQHSVKMASLQKKKEQRIQQENWATAFSLTGFSLDFGLGAMSLAMLGLGSLVGPLLWLMIGFGGIAILAELPGLAWNLLKKAVGMRVYKCPEDEEIDQLRRELEAYRPLLQKMVADAHVVVDPEFSGVHTT